MNKHSPITLLAATVLAFQLQAEVCAQTKPRTTAPPAAQRDPEIVAAAEAVNPFTKCEDCKAAIRRRVAVLPASIGSVAKDAAVEPSALSSRVVDGLEEALKANNEFIVTNRSDLGALIREQGMAKAGVTNKEIGPATGKIIPAELLIRCTIDRVDVSFNTRRTVSSNATELLRRAQAAETESLDLRDSAKAQQIAAKKHYQDAADMKAQNDQTMKQLEGNTSRSAANLGALSIALGAYGQASAEADAKAALKQANADLASAERKLLEARQFRERAERQASVDINDESETKAALVVIWRALDSLTGEVMAGETLRLTDSIKDVRSVRGEGSSSVENTSSNRSQNLVNKLIDTSVVTIAQKIHDKIDRIPFRGQVVKADKSGVVINVGSDRGVQEGDTFAVREVDKSLTDPTTGQALAGIESLRGLIRVNQVGEKISKATIIKASGTVSRGHVLEWVGVFK
jgi:Curli production assembly/transport component CsgG